MTAIEELRAAELAAYEAFLAAIQQKEEKGKAWSKATLARIEEEFRNVTSQDGGS